MAAVFEHERTETLKLLRYQAVDEGGGIAPFRQELLHGLGDIRRGAAVGRAARERQETAGRQYQNTCPFPRDGRPPSAQIFRCVPRSLTIINSDEAAVNCPP